MHVGLCEKVKVVELGTIQRSYVVCVYALDRVRTLVNDLNEELRSGAQGLLARAAMNAVIRYNPSLGHLSLRVADTYAYISGRNKQTSTPKTFYRLCVWN